MDDSSVFSIDIILSAWLCNYEGPIVIFSGGDRLHYAMRKILVHGGWLHFMFVDYKLLAFYWFCNCKWVLSYVMD